MKVLTTCEIRNYMNINAEAAAAEALAAANSARRPDRSGKAATTTVWFRRRDRRRRFFPSDEAYDGASSGLTASRNGTPTDTRRYGRAVGVQSFRISIYDVFRCRQNAGSVVLVGPQKL